MSTLNGFGTMFYGWKHAPDSASTATKWVAFFYIPIIPLGRYELNVKTDFRNESARLSATPAGLMASQTNHFEIAGKMAFKWNEALLTYAKAFLGLPFLMFAPLLIIWLIRLAGVMPHYQTQADTPLWFNIFLGVFVVAQLASVLYWPIWSIRQSRGKQLGGKPVSKAASAPVERKTVEHHL
jgi:hypothetical protein